jgi:hypothetical protein
VTGAPERGAAGGAAPRGPASLRRVVVPAEHGSWAFLGEPILLGLLVAPSAAGFLLASAALAGFLARRPLRIVVSDRRSKERFPRTAVAERAFLFFALVGAAALGGAFCLARGPVLVALAAAAPLGAVALGLDLDRRSREAAAEVTAALALGSVSTAIALAAGWPAAPAFALWGVLAARAVPTITYVRARLRLDKGHPARVSGAVALHLPAVAAVAGLAAAGLTSWLAVIAIAILAARAAYGLSPARPRLTTLQLGLSEVGFGLATVLSVWLGRVSRF